MELHIVPAANSAIELEEPHSMKRVKRCGLKIKSFAFLFRAKNTWFSCRKINGYRRVTST